MSELIWIFYNPWFAFVWGACWGSFLNVVIYRHPLGKSVVAPSSACPSCQNPIAFYDNIPVFSWLILGGRCRACRHPFSPMYAINEALFGSLFTLAVLVHRHEWRKGLAFGTALLALGPTTYLLLRYRRAPWYLVATGVGAGLFYLGQFLSG